jgi:hypothetical protein
MAGVFARTNEVNNHPKRNTFPLSFQNNLSDKFGVLYPCLMVILVVLTWIMILMILW